ncbi:MAG: hypothetical protein D6696_16580, partial [Acidobacteria bacterium]
MIRRATVFVISTILPLAFLAGPAAAGGIGGDEPYWPRWRGPADDGTAPGGDPPVTWSETENVRFKVAVPGKGHASPVVWGDRIVLLTAVPVAAPETSPPAEPPAATS